MSVSNSSRRRRRSLTYMGKGEGVGGAKHGSAGLDSVKALPNHADDGAREHCRGVSLASPVRLSPGLTVVDKLGKKGLSLRSP